MSSNKPSTNVRDNLSHPQWCNQADRDACGPTADFLGERWHSSDRSILFAPKDPIAGDEPLKATFRKSVMDGRLYDDDPGFGGGIEVCLTDLTTSTPDRKGWWEGGSARAYMNSQTARDLGASLIAEADAYDTWADSEDAARHVRELAAEQQLAVEEREKRSKKPKAKAVEVSEAPARPDLRPESEKRRLPAVVTSEFHPSNCARQRMCSNPLTEGSLKHWSLAKAFERDSRSGGPDTGQEMVAKVAAVVHHENDALEPEDFTFEALFWLRNEDQDRQTGVLLSAQRLRDLSQWMMGAADWVDEENERTRKEIQARSAALGLDEAA